MWIGIKTLEVVMFGIFVWVLVSQIFMHETFAHQSFSLSGVVKKNVCNSLNPYGILVYPFGGTNIKTPNP